MDIKEKKRKLAFLIIKNAAFDGWCDKNYMESSLDVCMDENAYMAFFPNCELDILREFFANIEEECEEEKIEIIQGSKSIRKRIRDLLVLTFSHLSPYKEGLRKFKTKLINPENILYLLSSSWEFSDKVWYGIGDESVDFNFYTKRAILSCVVSSSLVYWLNDESLDNIDTVKFIEKKLDNAVSIGSMQKKILSCGESISKLPFIRLVARKFKK